MVNSRAKGKRAELELANAIKELFGWKARRSQQFSGNAGDSDVLIEELPGVFVECKHVQSLSIVPVMRKAVEQCNGKLPVICHRKNHSEFLLTMRLRDLVAISELVCRLGCIPSKDTPESTKPNSVANT